MVAHCLMTLDYSIISQQRSILLKLVHFGNQLQKDQQIVLRVDRQILQVDRRVLRVDKRLLQVNKRVLRVAKQVLRVTKRVMQVLRLTRPGQR